MDVRWWNLPGPQRFIERVIEDLRSGHNAVLCLPARIPDGLLACVRAALEEQGFPVEAFRAGAENSGASPVAFLARQLDADLPSGQVLSVGMLLQHDQFDGRVLIMEIEHGCWPRWHDFLREYAHACQAREVSHRLRFCVALTGEQAVAPPPLEPRLLIHLWRDVPDRLDMLLYASLLLRDTDYSDLQRSVAANVLASLALWDPTVCDVLAAEGLERMLDPAPVLRELAVDWGWDGVDPDRSGDGWWSGENDLVDGKWQPHSALLALRGEQRRLDRRLWSGQVGVLLPYIEERRQAIVGRLETSLRLPHPSPYGVISDLHALEIGHIRAQLQQGVPASRELRRLVDTLHDMRNRLAHLHLVEASLLCRPELNLRSDDLP